MNMYKQLNIIDFVSEISYNLRCMIVKSTADPVRFTVTNGLSRLKASRVRNLTSDEFHYITTKLVP